jgi:hypothetical protein
MLNEPVAVTMLVIETLNALEIPYFIGGSLASSVRGVIRTTLDVDLVSDFCRIQMTPLLVYSR